MTEANPHNAVLAADRDVIEAVNSRNSERLALALEEGGGSAGSISLEHLLVTIMRKYDRVELVRKVGRGSREPLEAVHVEESWFLNGLPPEVRQALISGLRSGALILRKLRVPGRRGRPAGVFEPEIAEGSHIYQIARDLAIADAPEKRINYLLGFEEIPEKWLRQAVAEWVPRSRSELGLPPITTASEVDSLARRARRALAAYRKLLKMAEQIDN